ncbi:MAG TPA: HAMP domain-containing sensor histidine kinase [Candidatus Saccharimonadales bacterium]|nr:HAMP domain-containing sensor histidine kinase [Candidatus Saccharimonadales bacterium]
MPSFSQFLLDTKEQQLAEFRLRTKWMIRLRWLYVMLLGGVGTVSTYLAGGSKRRLAIYVLLSAGGLAINGLFWLAIAAWRRATLRYYQFIAFLQAILDLTIASSIIYLQGGLTSRATLLYAIPVLVIGILFERPAAYVAAAMSSLAYIGAVLGYALLNPHTYALKELYVPLTFYPCLLLLLAAIITRFSALNAMDERERTYQQLLAMLRHQLHHPPSIIAAIVEMLEHSDSYDHWSAKDKEYLRQLKRENMRLNTMITNVLAAANDQVTKPREATQAINLLELLNETAISCAIGAKRMKDLRTNLPIEHIMLDAEPNQLRIAMDNIIENAFHYSPAGTPVSVALSLNKKTQTITINVTDKGPGMTPAEQKNLWKLFSRLQEQTGDEDTESSELYGMSLGLYASKVIIERFEGTMELESQPGKGTSVIIKF